MINTCKDLALAVGILAIAVILSGILTGCNTLKGNDGNPVLSGTVCVETENGKYCYVPNPPAPLPAQTLEK